MMTVNRPETIEQFYIAERLRCELGLDPRCHELGIRVSVLLGERCIVLAGLVASEERREWIEILARELLPDYEIRNEVAVQVMNAPRRELIA
jgi:hypothetical protein